MLDAENFIDEVVRDSDEEALNRTHQLCREGFFAGVSSGANVLVALREARKFAGANIVTVLPDSTDRYFTEEHFVT